MKKIAHLAICLMFAAATNATADILRFTASNSTYGALGHMDFDSSIFNGTAVQFVDNSFMLSLDFTNPVNSFHITTIGPSGFGTYFDSTGILPAVLAGFGLQGGTAQFIDEVVIVTGSGGFGDPSNLILGNGAGNNLFSNVSWSASVVGAVPEPGTFALLLTGLGLLGSQARRRKTSSSRSASPSPVSACLAAVSCTE